MKQQGSPISITLLGELFLKGHGELKAFISAASPSTEVFARFTLRSVIVHCRFLK